LQAGGFAGFIDSKSKEQLARPMQHTESQVLFLGELPFWLRISQSVVEAPGASFQIHRSPTLRDALRRLDSEQWHALLLDLSHPSAQELLAARKFHEGLGSIPVVALLPISDPQFQSAAVGAGASSLLFLEEISAASLQQAITSAINSSLPSRNSRKVTAMPAQLSQTNVDLENPSKFDAISHAINNLLCVINANADILSDQIGTSHNAVRNLSQIKKATKSAAELMRLFKA
jgi:DNA-binding NarL/FixJ family response regulator